MNSSQSSLDRICEQIAFNSRAFQAWRTADAEAMARRLEASRLRFGVSPHSLSHLSDWN